MSFQALFGNVQSLLVQLGFLGHVPYLGDYYGPENQQGDRRRDRLLTEDPYARFYPGPVCLRLYPYVQGSPKVYDGLEDAPLRMLTCTPPVGMCVSVTSKSCCSK
jgi:hypothetical protein